MKNPAVNFLVVLLLGMFLLIVPVPEAASPAVAAADDAAGPSLTDIISRAAEANGKLESFKFNMDMKVVMEASGGAVPGSVTMMASGTGAVDIVKREMQTTMNVSMADGPGQPGFESQAESYIVGGWMYVKMTIPSVGVQWLKMELGEEQWQAQQAQFLPGGEWLRRAAESRSLGSEDFEGTPCYVVELGPSVEALVKWLSRQRGAAVKDLGGAGLDVARLIKGMSIRQWIAKDSYLLLRTDVELAMEVPGLLTMVSSVVMKSYDHNGPVLVELPADAASAIEAPVP